MCCNATPFTFDESQAVENVSLEHFPYLSFLDPVPFLNVNVIEIIRLSVLLFLMVHWNAVQGRQESYERREQIFGVYSTSFKKSRSKH